MRLTLVLNNCKCQPVRSLSLVILSNLDDEALYPFSIFAGVGDEALARKLMKTQAAARTEADLTIVIGF